jgi:hypothetical protein
MADFNWGNFLQSAAPLGAAALGYATSAPQTSTVTTTPQFLSSGAQGIYNQGTAIANTAGAQPYDANNWIKTYQQMLGSAATDPTVGNVIGQTAETFGGLSNQLANMQGGANWNANPGAATQAITNNMNPWQSLVTANTMDYATQAAQRAENADRAGAAQNMSGFGDRSQIALELANDKRQRGLNDLNASLNQQGFINAQQQSNLNNQLGRSDITQQTSLAALQPQLAQQWRTTQLDNAKQLGREGFAQRQYPWEISNNLINAGTKGMGSQALTSTPNNPWKDAASAGLAALNPNVQAGIGSLISAGSSALSGLGGLFGGGGPDYGANYGPVFDPVADLFQSDPFSGFGSGMSDYTGGGGAGLWDVFDLADGGKITKPEPGRFQSGGKASKPEPGRELPADTIARLRAMYSQPGTSFTSQNYREPIAQVNTTPPSRKNYRSGGLARFDVGGRIGIDEETLLVLEDDSINGILRRAEDGARDQQMTAETSPQFSADLMRLPPPTPSPRPVTMPYQMTPEEGARTLAQMGGAAGIMPSNNPQQSPMVMNAQGPVSMGGAANMPSQIAPTMIPPPPAAAPRPAAPPAPARPQPAQMGGMDLEQEYARRLMQAPDPNEMRAAREGESRALADLMKEYQPKGGDWRRNLSDLGVGMANSDSQSLGRAFAQGVGYMDRGADQRDSAERQARRELAKIQLDMSRENRKELTQSERDRLTSIAGVLRDRQVAADRKAQMEQTAADRAAQRDLTRTISEGNFGVRQQAAETARTTAEAAQGAQWDALVGRLEPTWRRAARVAAANIHEEDQPAFIEDYVAKQREDFEARTPRPGTRPATPAATAGAPPQPGAERPASATPASASEAPSAPGATPAASPYRTKPAEAGDPAEIAQTARQLNVPALTTLPWRGLSPKKREELLVRFQADFLKQDADRQGDIDQATRVEDLLGEWKALSGRANTGGAALNIPLIKQGVVLGSDTLQRMESITAEIAPLGRVAGSGAVSDFDAKQLVAQQPSIEKSKAANDQIIDYRLRAAANLKQKAEFDRAYFAANRTMQGAQSAWDEYKNANPLAVPVTNARRGQLPYKLVENRMTWQEYFRMKDLEKREGK